MVSSSTVCSDFVCRGRLVFPLQQRYLVERCAAVRVEIYFCLPDTCFIGEKFVLRRFLLFSSSIRVLLAGVFGLLPYFR